jgi:hypothetical protein
MRLPNVRLRVTEAVTPRDAGTAATNSEPTPSITAPASGADVTAPALGAHVAEPASGAHVAAPTPGLHVAAPGNITIQVAATGPDAGDSIATVDFDPWTHRGAFGVAIPKSRTDGNRFAQAGSSSRRQGRHVRCGRTATMPEGDVMRSGDTAVAIRPWYESDPRRSEVQAYPDGCAAPSSTYHRFWAQPDLTMANADYRMLFPAG